MKYIIAENGEHPPPPGGFEELGRSKQHTLTKKGKKAAEEKEGNEKNN